MMAFLVSRPKLQGSVIALALVLAFTQSAQALDLFSENAFAGRAPSLRNGEYLFNAAGCAGCHASAADPAVLSGGLRMESFIGTFFAPNITSSSVGIGGWSDAQFLNAVMYGVAPDGRNLYPVMPYPAYAGMNPTDVLDIKAYIATLPKSDDKPEAPRLSFPYNLNSTMALWKRYNLTTPPYRPSATTQLERGRYLVENVGACGECHTPRTKLFSRDDTHKFTGDKITTGAYAPDISASRVAAIGAETFERDLFSKGTKLNGMPITDAVMRRIVQGLGKLDEGDQRAIVAYLKGAEVAAPTLAATAEAACRDHMTAAAGLSQAGGDVALARAADGFVGKYCKNCHGPGESAQGSYPAGDLASIASDAHFVTPGNRKASLLFTVVKSGRMPEGSHPSNDEIDQLGQWIDSLKAAPAASAQASPGPQRNRAIIPTRLVAEQVLHDFETVRDSDKRFVRYISFVPQYNGELPCEDESGFGRRLPLFKAGFNKLLNSLSLGRRLIKPETVAESKDLLVRVDIRDLGWNLKKWGLLEAAYPYALDANDEPSLEALAKGMQTSVPVLRSDWFMANATKPSLYYPLLDLPANISGVEDRIGVDALADIRDLKIQRAGFLEGSSGVSDHNRMIERHATGQSGYYWKSYDFSSSNDAQSLSRHPDGPVDAAPLPDGLKPFQHAGGEMIFTLPNGMQGYYLSKANGDRLNEGPPNIVSFRQRPIGKGTIVVNARSCFDCHADGIIAKRDQLRDVVKSSGFNFDQSDRLFKMYVDQPELTGLYNADRAAFIAALEKIGVTDRAPDGSLKSMSGPNNEELITYYADRYEATLDEDALAAEFDMTREELESAIGHLDGDVLKIVTDWVNEVKAGARVPRDEVETQFPLLAKPLLRVAALKATHVADAASLAKTPAALPAYKIPEQSVADPAAQGAKLADKLAMAIKVQTTDVFVGDTLTFEVTANKACELQTIYVDSSENVVVISQQSIGEPFLQAQTPRRVPVEGSGRRLRFDGPGQGESLILICREGGLGDKKLTTEQAREVVRRSHLPAVRSLVEEQITPRHLTGVSETRSPQVEPSIATQLITFNVRPASH